MAYYKISVPDEYVYVEADFCGVNDDGVLSMTKKNGQDNTYYASSYETVAMFAKGSWDWMQQISEDIWDRDSGD